MLMNLGFRQVLPRAMPRANHPQRLKYPDQIWWRKWRHSEDNSKQFRREIADLKAEVLRGAPEPPARLSAPTELCYLVGVSIKFVKSL